MKHAWVWMLGATLSVAACKTDKAASVDAPSEGAAEVVPPTPPSNAPIETTPTLARAQPLPEEPAAEAAIADEPPTPPEVDAAPQGPFTVLILGDSLAATGFGALLERRLDAHPEVVAYRKGKSSSGLARPDFFDWIDQAKRQVEFRKPDLVIVIMGGNDGQDLTRGPRGGTRVRWDDERWAAGYRERMDALLAEVTGEDRRVLWLGLPTMGLRSLEKKLILIRDIQEEAVAALGDKGVYLDTAPFVTDEAGELLTHAKVGKHAKPQQIRAEDRIHFTMSGSEYFADRVYPEVLEALGIAEETEAEPKPEVAEAPAAGNELAAVPATP